MDCAPAIPDGIECNPQPASNGITQVCLNRSQQILAARGISREVCLVGGEQRRGSVQVEAHLLYRARKAKLGAERPSVGTEIDELCRAVLTGWSIYRQTCGEDEFVVLGCGELSWFERRGSENVKRKADIRARQSGPRDRTALFAHLPGNFSPSIWQSCGDQRLSSE